MNFENKTVLVTGASEGIGRATAIAFARQGANLICVARNGERLESLKKEVQKFQGKVSIFPVDLSQVSGVIKLFQQLEPFDIAINNAGIEGRLGAFTELNEDDFDEVFNLNVRSLFLCMKFEIENFIRNKKGGNIINLSSIAGFKGLPNSGLYVASKHAVLGLTRTAALEQIRNGIRVNCVSPGATDTAMLRRIMGDHMEDFVRSQPNGQLAQPSDIAKTIVWLASEDSQHIVGQDIVIDGGKTGVLA